MFSFFILLFRSRRPLVNYSLIAISIVVFIYELSLSGNNEGIFIWKYGLIAKELSEGIEFTNLYYSVNGFPVPVVLSEAILLTESGVPLGQDITSPIPTWGTVFTSMFLHGGPLHIIANMLFLYGFGDKVEQRLGHVKYLIFYLAAGVAAAWTQVATDMDSQTVLIGASGAIFGVVGAYLLAFPYRNTVALVFLFFILPLLFPIGSINPVNPGTGVAYMAHVGGFVAGVLFMAGYKRLQGEPILPRRRWRPGSY